MRDAFGPVDPDEIDVIDPDPAAFGVAATAPHDQPPRARRGRRIGGGLGAAAVLAAGVLVWAPWDGGDHGGKAQSFGPGNAGVTAGSEEWVLGDDLVLDHSFLPTGDTEALLPDDAVGHFFAAPGARFDLRGGSTFLAFYALPEASEHADEIPVPSADDADFRIQGAPARAESETDLLEVMFGPVDGWRYSVVASGITRAELLTFAEVVSVDGGVTVVADPAALMGLQPIGSVGAYSLGAQLLLFDGFSMGDSGTVAVCYENDVCLESAAADTDEDLVPMLHFLGGTGDTTVHGRPAVTGSALDTFGGGVDGDVAWVAWVEDGRLFAVTGGMTVDELTAIAETAHPASEAEWADVLRVVTDPFTNWEDVAGGDDVVTLDGGVVVANGRDGNLTVEWSDGFVAVCTETAASSECTTVDEAAGLPVLQTVEFDGGTWVVAVAPPAGDGPAAELVLTRADGSEDRRLTIEMTDPALPGPVIAVPIDGDTVAAVWQDGVLLAELPLS